MGLIKCAKSASNITLDVFNYLNNNTDLGNPSKFIEGFTDLLDLTDLTDLPSDQFLTESMQIVKSVAAKIEGAKLAQGINTVDFTGIGGTRNSDLVSGIQAIVADRVAFNNTIKSPTPVEPPVITGKLNDVNDTNEYVAPSIESEGTLLSDILSGVPLGKDDTTHSELVTKYFSNAPGMYSLFRDYVVNKYMGSIVSTEKLSEDNDSEPRFSESVAESFDIFKSYVDNVVSEGSLDGSTLENIIKGDVDNEVINAYFANIIASNPENILKLFIPSIKLDSANYNTDESGVRATYGEQEKFGGYDQVNPFMKAMLNSTPRLNTVNGQLTVDTKSPYLKDYEIKQVANDLGKLQRNLGGFEKGLYDLIESSTGQKKIILSSLYNRFFNAYDYKVDGVEHVSIANIAGDKANKFTSSLFTFMSSMQQLEHINVVNDTITVTHLSNVDAQYLVEESFMHNIQDPNNPRMLSSTVSDKISVTVDDDKNITINVGKYPIKIQSIDNRKNIPVSVSSDSLDNLKVRSKIKHIFKLLGLPTSFNDAFVDEYVNNKEIENLSTGDSSLPNFLANIAYGIALNDTASREQLENAGITIPAIKEKSASDSSSILYNPFEIASGFNRGVMRAVETVEGIGRKATRKNTSGDTVNNTGVKALMYELDRNIDAVNDAGIENTVFAGNPVAEGVYTVGGYYSKDGIRIGDKFIPSTALTEKQSYEYLIEKGYLEYSSKNRFKSFLSQIGAMSDRKLVELIEFKTKSKDILPKKPKDKINGSKFSELQKEFVDTLRAQHTGMANAIISKWGPLLYSYIDTEEGSKIKGGKSAVDLALTSVQDLDKFLYENQVPLSLVEGDNSSSILDSDSELASEYMYVKGPNKTVRLKQVFLEIKSIMDDDSSAVRFMDDQYKTFKRDVKSTGFEVSKKSLDVLRARHGNIGDSLLEDYLLYSYFYQNNVLSTSSLNMMVGSVYQHKGDLNLEAVENSPSFKSRVDAINTQEAAKETPDYAAAGMRIDAEKKKIALANAMNGMFVRQSKRNASLGSGFQHPRLAAPDERGAYIDEFTYTAVVEDPETIVTLLGQNLEEFNQEIYDAVMISHPLYQLKMKASLGGEYSGFDPHGGPIKDISMEIDPKTGTFRFQKKSTQDLISGMTNMMSPELATILKKMNTEISYEEAGVGTELILSVDEDGNPTRTQDFENLQDLWEEVADAQNTSEGWQTVLDVLSLNPAHRSLYVEKLGFKSGEKTGSRGINTKSVWESSAVKGEEGHIPLKYTKFSNKGHGPILNGDHHTELFGKGTKPTKTLMTQIVTAIILKGDTADQALKVNDALSSLTDAGIRDIEEDIWDIVDTILESDIAIKGEFSQTLGKEILDMFMSVPTTKEEIDAFRDAVRREGKLIEAANKEFVREISDEAAHKRDYYSLLTTALKKGGDANLNMAQTSQVAHSSVMALVSDSTAGVKFHGQELVVAASNDFVKLFTLGNGRRVTRDEYMKSPLIKEEPITAEALTHLHDHDEVNIGGGMTKAIWKIKKEAKRDGKTALELEELFSKAKARIPRGGDTLNWIKYKTGDTELTDTPEYKDLLKASKDLSESTDQAKSDLLKAEIDTVLRPALEALLDDSSKEWETTEAEFFAPAFMMNAYGITANDTLGDIRGHETTGEVKYFKNGREVLKGTENAEMVYQSEIDSMESFFTQKLKKSRKLRREHKLSKFEKIIGSLNLDTYEKLVAESEEGMINNNPNSLEYIFFRRQLDALTKTSLDRTDSKAYPMIKANINRIREKSMIDSIALLASAKARSFPQSLKLIVDRVPTQGKQSFISGKIVGFINSKRNSLFGATEMLTISGADLDYDKNHVMLYGMDDYGIMYDYSKYLVDGSINESAYEELVDSKVSVLVSALRKSGAEPSVIRKKVKALKKSESNYYKEAVKNAVVDNINIVTKSSKNAIEASTPVSVGNLKKLVSNDTVVEDDGDDSISVGGGRLMSIFSPSSIVKLERVNYDGKDGVGISASSLKTYGALFTGAMVDPNAPEIKISSNDDYLFTGPSGKPLFGEGINSESLELGDGYIFHTPEGERLNNLDIANVKKFLSESDKDSIEFKNEIQAWEEISEVLSASVDNANELILGKLGLNKDTISMTLTGSMLDIRSSDVIKMLQNPEVAQALKDGLPGAVKDLKRRYANEYYAAKRGEEGLKDIKDPRDTVAVTADSIIKQSGPNVYDLNITSPLANLEGLSVNNDTPINNEGLTDSEESQLKELLGDSYMSTNKSEATFTLRAITDADTIIVTSEESVFTKMARVYASKTGKSISVISPTGVVKDTKGVRVKNLVITPNTTFIGKDVTAGVIKSLNNKSDYVISAISDPEGFNAKAAVAHEREISDYDNKMKGARGVIDSYMKNDIIQIGGLLHASEEVSALTKLLGINRGLPNSEWDSYKYKASISKWMMEQGIDFTTESFDMFIKSASNSSFDNGAYADSIISDYESVKRVVNPFYIMKTNSHYLSYLKAMVEGEKIVDNASSVRQAVMQVVDDNKAYSLKDDEFKRELVPFVLSLGIDSFLGEDYSEFTIDGESYDLGTPQGRNEFVSNMPSIVSKARDAEELKDNSFLNDLNVGYVIDPISKINVPVLRTLDLSNLDEVKRSELQISLYALQNEGGANKTLHEALYLYSLITNKGRQSGSSFSSLFDDRTDAANAYSKHTNDDNIDIIDMIDDYSSVSVSLSVPAIIPSESTVASAFFNPEEGMEEDISDMQGGDLRSRDGSIHDLSVDMPSDFEGNLFKSKETGRIYYRFNEDEDFAVISPIGRLSAIMLNSDSNVSEIEKAGYDFGYDAVISSEGDRGRVLRYESGSYIVKDASGVESKMTADTLSSLNDNMLFRGDNFGVLDNAENKSLNKVEGSNEEIQLTNKLAGKSKGKVDRVAAILNNDVRYDAIRGKVGSVKVGDVLDTYIDYKTGATIETIYKGYTKINNKIKTGLGKSMPNTYNSRIQKGEVKEAHLVEYVIRNTPNVISDGDSMTFLKAHKSIGEDVKRRLFSSEASHFVTKYAVGIEEGSKVMSIKDSSGKERLFMVTNHGPANKYVNDKGLSKEKLRSMLGQVKVGKVISNIFSDENIDSEERQQMLYSAVPYNAKFNSTNTKVESRFIGDEVVPNLSNYSVVVPNTGKTDAIHSSLEEYGIKDVSIERGTTVTTEGMESAADQANVLYPKKTGMTEEDIMNSYAVENSDTVVIIDDISEISKEASLKAGFNKKKNLNKSQKDVLSIVEKISKNNDVIDTINDIVTKIADNDLHYSVSSKFRAVVLDNDKLSSILMEIKSNMEEENTVPTEMRFKTTSSTVVPLQVSKESNKPTFVYSPTHEQWFKYNSQTGSFDRVSIPIMSGTTAIINADASRGDRGIGLQTLLKKTSTFVSTQEGYEIDLATASDLYFSDTPVSEKINLVDAEGSLALVGTSGVSVIGEFNESIKVDNGNGVELTRGVTVNGVQYLPKDFRDYSDATITRQVDGTVMINTGFSTFVSFPSDRIRSRYGNFTGYSVKENMKIKVGDEYFVIEEAHKTTKEIFERRDQLLEEKKKLSELYNKTKSFLAEEIDPIYRSIRYENVDSYNEYKDYTNYRSFILHLKNGDLKVDPKHDAAVQQLLDKHDEYMKLFNEAKEYRQELGNAARLADAKVRTSDSSFFSMKKGSDNVLVFLTDTNSNHTDVSNDIIKDYLNSGKNKLETQKGADKNLKSFAVGVAQPTSKGYTKASSSFITAQVSRMIGQARSNSNKTFYVDIPGGLEGSAFKGVSNKDVLEGFAKAINNNKKRGLPSNIIFTRGMGDHLNNMLSSVDPSKINYTAEHKVTNDATRFGVFDVKSSYLANPYELSIDGDSIISLYTEGNDKSYNAYKSLWRKWATLNPSAFNKLAASVGNKVIYDTYYSKDNPTSIGRVLVDILTERFVDNSWVDLDISSVDTKLDSGQYMLPVSSTGLSKISFNNGKAMLSIEGNMYIATVLDSADGSLTGDSINMDIVNGLGLGQDSNALSSIETKYPFLKTEGYKVLSLSAFSGEFNKAESVPRGTFSDALADSNVEVSKEHMNLASKATIALGIDTQARISDSIESTLVGTPWIRSYKERIGDGIVTDISMDDSVWIYGSTLGKDSPVNISETVKTVKTLIDKVAKSGAEILIGNDNGVEEEVKAYIESKYPDYIRTPNGYKIGLVETNEDYITVWKSGPAVTRFNINNSVAREGGDLKGPTGVILNGSSIEGSNEYKLNIKEDEVTEWGGMADAQIVSNVLNGIGVSEGDSGFDGVRGKLITKNQRLVSRLIQVKNVSKIESIPTFDTLRELDAFLLDTISSNEGLSQAINEEMEIMFTEDGRFNLSDIATLAMARDFNNTYNYVSELIPDVITDKIVNSNAFELIHNHMIDTYLPLKRELRSNLISEETMSIIDASTNTTYRDIYNLGKTIGADRVVSAGLLSTGYHINKAFIKNGIKVFSSDGDYTVIDSSIVKGPQSSKFDQTETTFEEKSTMESNFAKKSPVVYKYLNNNGFITFSEDGFYVKGVDRYYSNTDADIMQATKDIKTLIAEEYVNGLEGVDLSATTFRDNIDTKFIVDNHISRNGPIKFNALDELLRKRISGPLDDNSKVGKVYNMNGVYGILLNARNGELFVASDGTVLNKIDGQWELSTEGNLTDKPATEFKLATGKSKSGTYSNLMSTDGRIIEGLFEVTKSSRSLEAESENGDTYEWSKISKSWVATNNRSINLTVNMDRNIVEGQPVQAINSAAGVITLIDGIATSDTIIEDDKGTYTKDKNGVWSQTKVKGGLNNSKVRFQKEEVSYTDDSGSVVASKRVSKSVMTKVMTRLFDKVNVETEISDSETIRQKYGEKFADASGFVIDGKVVINLDNATLDTPLHELGGHIYLAHLKAENPSAYDTIISMALDHDIAEDIINRYPENTTREEIGEEIFSTLFGLENQGKLLEEPMTKWQRIKEVANDASGIWDLFTKLFNEVFGINVPLKIEANDSLMSIIDKVGKDLVFNDNSVLSNLTDNQKDDIKFALDPVMDEQGIMNKLKSLGYIREVCV